MKKNLDTLSRTSAQVIAFALFLFTAFSVNAQSAVPRPDHVVILVMENHGYEDIIGNAAAPYINTLANENASLTQSYALSHPSQPNYLMLFSGSNQGVTDDNVPAGIPWSVPNLGSALIQQGFTFKAYSDGLPSVGFTGTTSGAYRKKHAPWTNWQGTGTNHIPSSKHRPFTDFPTNFSSLPDVSFVIPDQNNDMHDGTIQQGDAWIQTNLGAYITWAKTNNSLFILTFDEDDGDNLNHITTIFAGEMVQSGTYSIAHNHYDMLRTLEDMYGLTYAGNSTTATAITEVWIPDNANVIKEVSQSFSLTISPNPLSELAQIKIKGISDLSGYTLLIFDILGNEVKNLTEEMKLQNGSLLFNREGMQNGIYFYRLTSLKQEVYSGKIIVK